MKALIRVTSTGEQSVIATAETEDELDELWQACISSPDGQAVGSRYANYYVRDMSVDEIDEIE